MNRKTTYILVSLVVAVIGGSLILVITQRGADAMCSRASIKTWTVIIQDSKVSQPDVKGKVCDRLTFVNRDNITREIAFGPHENHVPYDGVAEKFLNKNQSFTITLNKAGSFHWHDHIHDEVEGYFSVTK